MTKRIEDPTSEIPNKDMTIEEKQVAYHNRMKQYNVDLETIISRLDKMDKTVKQLKRFPSVAEVRRDFNDSYALLTLKDKNTSPETYNASLERIAEKAEKLFKTVKQLQNAGE